VFVAKKKRGVVLIWSFVPDIALYHVPPVSPPYSFLLF